MRNYKNCELTLIDSEYRQQWLDGRIMHLSDFEWWVIKTLCERVFGYCANACFCDGFYYLDINASGHNDCVFIHRNKFGSIMPLYFDEDDNLYLIRMN